MTAAKLSETPEQRARHRLSAMLRTEENVLWLIDPFMAAAMLALNDPTEEDPRPNRPISAKTVKEFAADMKRGGWMKTGEPIIVADNGRLNDGQHRLLAVMYSGCSVPMHVQFGADREAFIATDIGRKRSSSDGMTIKGESYASILAAALRLYACHTGGDPTYRSALSPPNTAALLEQHPGFREAAVRGNRWGSIFTQIPKSIFAFCWYICAERDRAAADAFFEMIATSVGYDDVRHPANAVHRYFVNAKGRGYRLQDAKIAIIIKGWNDFRRGKQRAVLKWQEDETMPTPI